MGPPTNRMGPFVVHVTHLTGSNTHTQAQNKHQPGSTKSLLFIASVTTQATAKHKALPPNIHFGKWKTLLKIYYTLKINYVVI